MRYYERSIQEYSRKSSELDNNPELFDTLFNKAVTYFLITYFVAL
jgi:hypothetical protein